MFVRQIGNHSVRLLGHRINEDEEGRPEEGKMWFGIDWDSTRYDSGILVIASYQWNEDEPECPENTAILSHTNLSIDNVALMLPTALELGRSVANLVFKSQRGEPSVILDENQPIFPTVPADLTDTPRISIRSLTRLQDLDNHTRVDAVCLHDHSLYFAFKHYPYLAEDEPTEDLLSELQLLLQINSPYVIKPSHLVVEETQNDIFRGFLMPYYSHGSLTDVLRRSDRKSLEWSLKEKWAFQISAGVATLHQRSYSGDLKLDNILVSDTNDICLIDVAPTQGYTVDYIAPEFTNHQLLELTSARDIYALGIVLWAIAAEKADFIKEEIGLWEETGVQTWYKHLVDQCLAHNPHDRPTADVVSQTCLQASRVM